MILVAGPLGDWATIQSGSAFLRPGHLNPSQAHKEIPLILLSELFWDDLADIDQALRHIGVVKGGLGGRAEDN
jgi:hypothetical protein